MARIEQKNVGNNESTTLIRLDSVWEEKAAIILATTVMHEITNPKTAETRGLGQIHEIIVDLENGAITSDAFDTSINEGKSHHAMGSTYADEILFAVETKAEEYLLQINGN